MNDPVLIATVALAALVGALLLGVVAAERRRRTLQERLAAIAASSRSAEGSADVVSLRRAAPVHGWRSLIFLPGQLFAKLDAAFAAAGNRIGLAHLLAAGIIAAAAVFALTDRVMGLHIVLALLLTAAGGYGGAYGTLRLAQSHYQNRFLEVFPDALDLIVRGVRAGLPPLDAISVAAREISAPVGVELQQALDEMQIGVPMDEALLHTAERLRVADFRFFVVAIVLQRRTGGSLAETLAALSVVIRQRRLLRMKARALTAEAKASAAVIAVMPFVGFIGLYWISPKLMSVMFNDPRGRFMLGVAIVSMLAGMGLMAAIIRRVTR